ncbi:esterase/lipase family protein [Pleionea litopenaei]|uniref:Alpha/beta hydrolase n=1 Tax=Pleionea litopenaei TaxID=3070815 RepID=A0AA51X7R2_9GAMM|nr:alpha/beta hydrolase [Pleionea sp. HL-JVS1]WMS88136.1 alpha/beta hydrolase [Pleionea sp. HL-JVS1]
MSTLLQWYVTYLQRYVSGYSNLWLLFVFSALIALTSLKVSAASISTSNEKNFQKNSLSNGCVVLLHGMGRSDRSMLYLQNKLEASNYQVVNLDYPSLHREIETLALVSLPLAIKQCKSGVSINFVTHSLGGILVRSYLQEQEIENLNAIVMIGPPNRGSKVADNLLSILPNESRYAKRLSQISKKPTAMVQQLKPINATVGVIAGTRSLNPIFSSWLPGLDDGKVAVSDTCLKEMSDRILIADNHTTLLLNRSVADEILHFLTLKRFSGRSYHFVEGCE